MTDLPPSYPPPPPPPPGSGFPPPSGEFGYQPSGDYGYPPPSAPAGGGYGYPQPPPAPGGFGYPGYPQRVGTNALAVASLACSLVGACCGIGPVAGIILGIVALSQIRQSGEQGRGLAIAGVAVGGVVIVLWAMWLFISLATGVHRHHTMDDHSAPAAVVISVASQPVSPSFAA